MSWNELQLRFPNMKPVNGPPVLFTLNGCGTSVYGSRDHDPDTGAYIKTLVLTIVFLPVLALRAYRVADAPEGWYFLGREPLSAFAKAWNAFVGMVAAGLILAAMVPHGSKTPAPSPIPQMMADADAMAAQGGFDQAAEIWEKVVHSGGANDAQAAVDKFQKVFDEQIAKAPGEMTAKLVGSAVRLHQSGWGKKLEPLVPRVEKAVERLAPADPFGAVAVLDALLPLAADPAEHRKRRVGLLRTAVAKFPDKPEPAVALAVELERDGKIDDCLPLLDKHKDRLGNGEGARILGRLLAGRDRTDDAVTLLTAYTAARMDELQSAQTAYSQLVDSVRGTVLENFNRGQMPPAIMTRFKLANEEGRNTILSDYIHSALKNDTNVEQARQKLLELAPVASCKLELGMLLLHRGQSSRDARRREADLKEAESAFLYVRTVAGESDSYRLGLGQVCYWLGKPKEGRKHFDDLLEANGRGTEALRNVAGLLREVGEVVDARKMVEEAYAAETAEPKKKALAAFRSVMSEGDDDRLVWLQRSDNSASSVKASIAELKGRKALGTGDTAGAAALYREAIAHYAELPEDDVVLNNSAVAMLALYSATGDRADLDSAVQRLEKAVARRPTDSIVVSNVIHVLGQVAARDVGGSDAFEAARMVRRFLADTPQKDAELRGKLAAHRALTRALELSDKLLVIAPRSDGAIQAAWMLRSAIDDVAGLQALAARVRSAPPPADEEAVKGFLSGADDVKWKPKFQERIRVAEVGLADLEKRSGAAFAVAVSELGEAREALAMLGPIEGLGDFVTLAEKAFASAPSYGSRNTLADALLMRADGALARERTDYAAFVKRYGRSLDIISRLAAAPVGSGELGRAISANADVRRAVELLKADLRYSTAEWALIRLVDPPAAEAVAAKIKADAVSDTVAEIRIACAPNSPSNLVRKCWRLMLDDKADAVPEMLRKANAAGFPVPEKL